jgi:predicted alpha/beta superfamily hydrolase
MRKLGLTVFLAMPVIVIALLCYWIAISLNAGIHKQPPIGAGGGETGGANAIGEFIKERTDATPAIKPMNGSSGGEDTQAPAKVNPATLESGFIIIVEDKAKLATTTSPIYIAGNFNNWNPADPAYKLTPQSDMRWRILLTKPKSKGNASEPVEFKFTRGSWELEELKDDMSSPGNRTLPLLDPTSIKQGEIPSIEMAVSKWGDQKPDFHVKKSNDPYRAIQATGTVKRLQVHGGVGAAAGSDRDLLVWLPPGYESNPNRTYPVLYLHDAQNVFDFAPPTPGEWKADETATQLVTQGLIEPLIIVAIPHSGATRLAEYVPPLPGGMKIMDQVPQGDKHVAWLLSEVKPRVERAFRVKTDAANTAVGGSSLGGLISLYAGTQHPEVFGKVLAESPSLAFGGTPYWKSVFEPVQKWPGKIYIGVGGRERVDDAKGSELFAGEVKQFNSFLESKGFTERTKRCIIEKDAVHNEDAWAKRFPEALRFLFPAPTDATK